MSSGNTETRILQMQLENKDFEEGVRQTIKSLESLEEKLNLKNAGDGFEKVSAAANSVQMGHLESGLDAVTNKFTLMGQIGLQVIERISGKIVDMGEKVLRAATIQPMIDGWGEFEMKTNSVQTILGGIRNQFDDQPTAIHAIAQSLDELNEYADKTIYNFAQMTENVGKFTNQGLGLEESTNAIKGIANWAAAVGADPQQMSRAMYNISQSLGAGSMQLIDWRSIRFANMATPEVKKLFAEVAKVQGTISKEGTIKIGKQTLNVLEDFESTLKGGWLTNEVMAEAFSIYANAYDEVTLIEKYGEELGKQFYEMGVYAEEAATKVRTFTQLMGVLAESLGSGWANTFDILFGGFEQQTEFLTLIKERLESIIDFQTKDRNTWLQNFSDIGGITTFQDVILQTIDILSDFYWVFNDVAALVLNPFGKSVFNMTDGIFGPRQEGYTQLQHTWEGVKGIFDDISATLENFRRWMYSPGSGGRSPIHNLANALSGVAGAAGIAWQVLTGFGKFVFRLFKRFEPVVSSVLDLLGQIGGAIYNVFFNLTGQQSIEKVFDKIEGAIGPVISLVSGLASAVIDLIHSFLGIDRAADDWTVLGDRMQAFWKIFEYDSKLDFAQNLKNSLKNSLVAVFGQDTANSLITAWDTNIAPVLEKVSGFFTQAFADLNRLLNGLRNAATADYSQAGDFKGRVKTFLDAFLEGYYPGDEKSASAAYENILSVYQKIEEYYNEYVKPYVDSITEIFTVTLPELNAKIVDFLFGHDEWVYSDSEMGTKVHKGGLLQSITDFFGSETWKEDWEQIKGAFTEISGWITSNGEAAWNTIMDFLFGKEMDAGDGSKMRYGGAYDAALEFLNPVWDWIQEKGNQLYNYITTHNFSEMWQGLNDLLFGYDETFLDERAKGSSVFGSTIHHDGLLAPLLEVLKPISEAFNQVKGWALDKLSGIDWSGIWESIGKFFNGYDESGLTQTGMPYNVHHEGAFEKIIGFFDQIIDYFQSPEFQAFLGTIKTFYKTYIEPTLNWLSGLGGELWGAIEGVFSGKGLGAFDKLGTYLTNGVNSLIGNIFPKGFDLQGLLGGLFGGDAGTPGANEKAVSGQGSGGFLEWISNMLMGSANAAEADEANIENASNGIIAVLDQTKASVENASTKGAEASDSLLGSVSKLFPYIAGAGGIALVGKVSDMITGITGNRKPTIIEQIGRLISSFGDAFKGLGILVAGSGFAEMVSPGVLDRTFTHITNLLNTVFTWLAGIGGGGALLSGLGNFFGNWGLNRLTGAKGFSFDGVAEILSSIGEGISGLFDGLQTLFNLTWEVMGADILMGAENFDKRIERVIGFVGKIVTGVLENSVWLEIANIVNTFAGGGAQKLFGNDSQIESLSKLMGGLGALITGVGDGIAAIMTSSIVPSIIGVDTSKIVDIINATFTGLNILVGLEDVGTLVSKFGSGSSWFTFKALAGAGGGIAVALAAIGSVAGLLIDWYMGLAKKHMTLMAPVIYNFATNLTGALTALASIKGDAISEALSVLKDDMPEVFESITSDDIGFDKAKIEERGSVIRDFGNRVKTGIGSLAAAKKAFDEYNDGGDDSFPLAFFKSMTAALEYLKTGGVQELYEEFFATGFGGGPETADQEKGVLGIVKFFDTLGHLGYAVTKYDNTDFWGHRNSGTKLESTKQYLDDFQDAFSGIQTTFGLLIQDMDSEGFSIEKMDSLTDLITKVGEAGKTFASAYYHEIIRPNGEVVKELSDISPIMNMASWLDTIGRGIRDFDTALKTNGSYDINYGQLESALNSLKPLAELEQLLQGYVSVLDTGDEEAVRENLLDRINKVTPTVSSDTSKFESGTKHWIDDIMPMMTELGQGLHSMAAEIKPEDIASLGSASGTLTSLASFMSADLYPNIQAMTIEQIGSYTTAFSGLRDSLIMPESASSIASMIQEVMNATGGKPISMKITPIVDDSKLGANLPDGWQMENTYSRMINMQMNMNDVQNVRVDAAQISQLVEANNSTRDKIDTLATSIRNLKIQVLVPPGGVASGPRTRTVETYPLVANYQSPYDNP